MKLLHLLSGRRLEVRPTRAERALQRVKQMRVVIWCGIQGMTALQAVVGGRLVMHTLTYADVDGWGARDMCPVTRHLREVGAVGYVWVMELQKRGAPHYHLLALYPPNTRWRKLDAEPAIWTHGFTWVTDGIRYPWYILKYIQKGVTSDTVRDYPKGARVYGIARRTITAMPDLVRRTYSRVHLPSWFREGEKDCVTDTIVTRVAGGVRNGRMVALSPYTTNPLPRIRAVKRSMIQCFSSGRDCPAG